MQPDISSAVEISLALQYYRGPHPGWSEAGFITKSLQDVFYLEQAKTNRKTDLPSSL